MFWRVANICLSKGAVLAVPCISAPICRYKRLSFAHFEGPRLHCRGLFLSGRTVPSPKISDKERCCTNEFKKTIISVTGA